MSYPIFDLLSIHCSRLLNRKFSSFQTKFRQGVMLKYLIFVPKATVFILFLLYLLVIFIFLCFYLPSYYWFFFIFLLLFSFFIVAVFLKREFINQSIFSRPLIVARWLPLRCYINFSDMIYGQWRN